MTASAESIAVALAGRRTSRGWRAPCPAHPDKNPSLDLAERDGRVLFVCRAGCSQREVLDALSARGLWSLEGQPSRPIADPFPASAFHEPTAPACCFQGPPHDCGHWQRFDADMTIAKLHENLSEAAAEVAGLFQTAGYELTNDELHDELNLAIELGGSAIVPWHMSAGAVAKMIDFVVAEVVGDAARAA